MGHYTSRLLKNSNSSLALKGRGFKPRRKRNGSVAALAAEGIVSPEK